MARVNIRESNPYRYARVKAEQEKLQKQFCGGVMMARLCPYCDHKIEILCRGTHGPAYIKCPNCGEESLFPTVSFRRAKV